MTPDPLGIVLVGYRGTGKTTVARIIAHRLNRPLIDIDQEIETLSGRSIGSIFVEDGEAAFRDWESRVILGLSDRVGGGVVASGGGAILREANRKRLRDFGFVAWLTADVATLAHRLQAASRGVEDRPALTAAGTLDEIGAVLEARTPLYREASDVSISTESQEAEQVALAVIEAWSRHRESTTSGAS